MDKQNSPSKILYISDGNPDNYRLWSGTVKSTYDALRTRYDVDYLDVSRKSKLCKLYFRIMSWVFRKLHKGKYISTYTILNAKIESKILNKYLKHSQKYDYIFCAAKSGSIAYAKTDVKIIYLTDATFSQMIDYYEYLTGLSSRMISEGNIVERRAINNSYCVICASDWCKKSVENDYHYPRTVMVPFGANLLGEIVHDKKNRFMDNRIEIMFCGVDWERKGGEIAVKTVSELKKCGYSVRLYLVGCNPPYRIESDDIVQVGFLDKNDDGQRIKLLELYSKIDFLLLPTKAECAGIVFAEAAAYGIPSITYDTGGVATYVRDGINGYRLPVHAKEDEFALKISELVTHKEKYEQIRASSAELFKSDLNWDAWLKRVTKIIDG